MKYANVCLLLVGVIGSTGDMQAMELTRGKHAAIASRYGHRRMGSICDSLGLSKPSEFLASGDSDIKVGSEGKEKEVVDERESSQTLSSKGDSPSLSFSRPLSAQTAAISIAAVRSDTMLIGGSSMHDAEPEEDEIYADGSAAVQKKTNYVPEPMMFGMELAGLPFDQVPDKKP